MSSPLAGSPRSSQTPAPASWGLLGSHLGSHRSCNPTSKRRTTDMTSIFRPPPSFTDAGWTAPD